MALPPKSLPTPVLHDRNSFPSMPIGHSMQMKEIHKSMNHLLSGVNYQEHKWLIYGNLNVIRGLQGGSTEYSCFLCLWDSQADDQHYASGH